MGSRVRTGHRLPVSTLRMHRRQVWCRTLGVRIQEGPGRCRTGTGTGLLRTPCGPTPCSGGLRGNPGALALVGWLDVFRPPPPPPPFPVLFSSGHMGGGEKGQIVVHTTLVWYFFWGVRLGIRDLPQASSWLYS